jgi:hypothetical protein
VSPTSWLANRHGARPAPSGKGSRCSRTDQSLGLERPHQGGAELLGLEQPAGRTADTIGCSARFSAVDCSSAALTPGAGTGRPRRGASRYGSHLVSSCAHPAPTVVPSSQREQPMCHRRATPWPPSLPPSAKSLVIPTVSLPVQSAAQGEHPLTGIVQHFGSPIARVRVTRAAGVLRRSRGGAGGRVVVFGTLFWT